MSLVIDALRRAEKGDGAAPSAAIRLAVRRPRARTWPLVLAALGGLALGLAARQPARPATDAQAGHLRELPDSPWGPGRRVIAAQPPSSTSSGSETVPADLAAARVPRSQIRAAAGPPAPTQAASTTPTPSGLVLHAISSRDGTPIAMINGRLVREGETIDGFRVTRIGAETVEAVAPGGGAVVLSFPELPSLPEPTPTWDPRRP